jgi:hypothetical protein
MNILHTPWRLPNSKKSYNICMLNRASFERRREKNSMHFFRDCRNKKPWMSPSRASLQGTTARLSCWNSKHLSATHRVAGIDESLAVWLSVLKDPALMAVRSRLLQFQRYLLRTNPFRCLFFLSCCFQQENWHHWFLYKIDSGVQTVRIICAMDEAFSMSEKMSGG